MASINSGSSGDVMLVFNYAIPFTSIIKWVKGSSWVLVIMIVSTVLELRIRLLYLSHHKLLSSVWICGQFTTGSARISRREV